MIKMFGYLGCGCLSGCLLLRSPRSSLYYDTGWWVSVFACHVEKA